MLSISRPSVLFFRPDSDLELWNAQLWYRRRNKVYSRGLPVENKLLRVSLLNKHRTSDFSCLRFYIVLWKKSKETQFCYRIWLNTFRQLVLITNLTHFFNVFISLLYMFRATQCSSSGESIVSIHHTVCITVFLSDLHTRWPPTRSDIYQMMYWYNWFSWWWALDCSKHMKSEINTLKKYVQLAINTNYTKMQVNKI